MMTPEHARQLLPGDRVDMLVRRLRPCPTQPRYKPNRVAWLVANWNPEEMTPLRVYERDGRWWIRNGQHRWLAARELGVRELPVEVYDGPSRPWHQVAITPRGLDWWQGGACPYTPRDDPDANEYAGGTPA